MRTKVALVEARPETISSDYHRVLELSGLADLLADETPRLLLTTGSGNYAPGWQGTPWQLAGTLAWLQKRGQSAELLSILGTGAGPLPAHPMWQEQATGHQAKLAGAEFLRPHRHQSQLLHPALDAVLPNGVQVPVGLATGPAVLLTSPAVAPGGKWQGAGQALQSLVTGGASASRKAPAAEVTAESVGVARELMPRLGAVLDGTLWGVERASGGRQCVARNILLAGTDAVAVDAVAMRLAGIEPMRVPWVRLCRDRGFGRATAAEIQIVGRTDLLNLDFGLLDLELGPKASLPRGGQVSGWAAPLTRLMERALGRQKTAGMADTPWQQLYDEYALPKQAHRAGTP